MGSGLGHIQLERSLESIQVGRRHRADLGDLDALAASIQRDGLLQPITITPDGFLVCGQRRLAALRQLGWKTVNVWVRSGISGALAQLLAEQDENALHKPLSPIEAAGLYRELKGLLAEDAARRQEASRFASDGRNPRSHGAATVAAPSPEPAGDPGDTRAQAALMITGRNSYTSLERIGDLQRIAADPTQAAAVRERAAAELAGIGQGGSITAAHQRTRAQISLAELDRIAADPGEDGPARARALRDAAELRAAQSQARAADLERMAAEALARVRGAARRSTRASAATAADRRPGAMTLRAFVLTWDDLAAWWERADPRAIGPALSQEQWDRFQQTVAGTVAFAHAADTARRTAGP